MPLRYKIDILAALKNAGYTTYRIRKDGLLSQSTLQKLREGIGVSWDNVDTLCRLLHCQPGELLQYVADYAPAGEWCDSCERLAQRCQAGQNSAWRPWCNEYATELIEKEGKTCKCDTCRRDSDA